MCAYFSKEEDETSENMKQAAKEALNASKTEFEIMKIIAKAYSKGECSALFFRKVISQKSGIEFLKRNAKLMSSQKITMKYSNVVC